MEKGVELMSNGVILIAKERNEQILKHGKTIQHDVDSNKYHQLTKAASLLCSESWGCMEKDDVIDDWCPPYWKQSIWENMMNKPYKERLIIAGALIAAEIDRLQAINQ